MNLSTRERQIIVEVLRRQDPDTLNEGFGEHDVSGSELDALADKILQSPND